MRVLVTGASSYVGARLYSDLRGRFDTVGTYNTTVLFPELKQLDITKKDSVDALIQTIRPDVIVHVAANPSASWCEKNPDLAKEINIEGTRNIVNAADDIGARVIYISSFAAIDHSTLYGETKLAGEDFVKKAKKGYIILRPSLIIGYSPNTTNDRPHNRMVKNITEGTSPVYDTSWRFQPTWLGHLSECINLLIERDISGETIPIAVPELKSRYDIARDVLSYFGIKAIPEDKKDPSPVFEVNLDKLRELNLPQYKYEEVISKVVDEIKEHLKKE